jgi:hypothetical protein
MRAMALAEPQPDWLNTQLPCGQAASLPQLHKVSGERWLRLSFHSSSRERASLIGSNDLALGGRQVGEYVEAKRALERRLL